MDLPDYHMIALVEAIKLFLADTFMHQAVDVPTRFATVGQDLLWSLIDHCYVTAFHSFEPPQVQEWVTVTTLECLLKE